MIPLRTLLAALGLCTLGVLTSRPAQAQDLRPVPVVRGLQSAWAFAFLPDGRLLVTERPGRMRVVEADGTLRAPLAGLPPVAFGGQGGLLDVVLHPRFAENRWVYWSYAEAGDGGAGTAVARGRLDLAANRLNDVQVIFRQQPKVSGGNHFGSRLAFAPDGRLFVGLGDRFHRKDDAQDLSNHLARSCASRTTAACRATTPSWPAPARAARSGATATAMCRGRRSIRAAAHCGPPSTARKAATN